MYSAREAGEILSVHRATIKAWIREGRLPAVLVGGSWRLTEETIQEIIKNGFDIQPKTVGRPKGGSITGKPTLEAAPTEAEISALLGSTPAIDCGYPMSPESEALMKADAKAKREAKAAQKKEGGKDAHN